MGRAMRPNRDVCSCPACSTIPPRPAGLARWCDWRGRRRNHAAARRRWSCCRVATGIQRRRETRNSHGNSRREECIVCVSEKTQENHTITSDPKVKLDILRGGAVKLWDFFGLCKSRHKSYIVIRVEIFFPGYERDISHSFYLSGTDVHLTGWDGCKSYSYCT